MGHLTHAARGGGQYPLWYLNLESFR